MSASQNICLACGLCCDGTLIGFVELDREEIPELKKIKHVEEANGDGFFLQPCDQFCDGCTIYNERPKQCAQFECGLLQSVAHKEIPFEKAEIIVQEVKQQRAAIKKQVKQLGINLESRSFHFQMTELKSFLIKKEKSKAFSKDFQKLKNDLSVLDQIVESEFGLSKF